MSRTLLRLSTVRRVPYKPNEKGLQNAESTAETHMFTEKNQGLSETSAEGAP